MPFTLTPLQVLILAGILLFCLATLVFEKRGTLSGRLLFKGLASLGVFLFATTLVQGSSLYGMWILLGIGFALCGDLALVFPGKIPFLLGMAFFLGTHIFYLFALLGRPLELHLFWAGALPFLGLGIFLFFRYRRRIERGFHLPLWIYALALIAMVGCALASLRNPGGTWIAMGAILFAISDLFVARDAFLAPAFRNKVIGLPLYFLAQVLIALSLKG